MQRRLDLLVLWSLLLLGGLVAGLWLLTAGSGVAVGLLWPGFRTDLETKSAIDNMGELVSAAQVEEELLLRLLRQVGGASGPVVARVSLLHVR